MFSVFLKFTFYFLIFLNEPQLKSFHFSYSNISKNILNKSVIRDEGRNRYNKCRIAEALLNCVGPGVVQYTQTYFQTEILGNYFVSVLTESPRQAARLGHTSICSAHVSTSKGSSPQNKRPRTKWTNTILSCC